jgi:L-iditol 2-dehydrogenase
VGDRVIATHHVPCLECRYCRSGRETACELLHRTAFDPGGFAAFVRVPAANVDKGGVLPLPDHVSDDAASMVEPLGCVLRGQRRAGVGPGDTVLITGAGVSGCLHLLAARALGAAHVFVSDPLPARRRIAVQLGADAAFDTTQPAGDAVRAATGHSADRVIVCAGAPPAVAQALTAVDRGGTVLYFAPMRPGEVLPLPFNDVFWRHEATLASSYGAAPADLAAALAMMAERRVDVAPLVTHRLPLADIQHGFDLMLDPQESLKIIIDPRLDG